MTLLTTLPIIDKEITKSGIVKCIVSASAVHITLYKFIKEKNNWGIISDGNYGVRQGFSNILITTVDAANRWKVTIKGADALSAMDLTIP